MDVNNSKSTITNPIKTPNPFKHDEKCMDKDSRDPNESSCSCDKNDPDPKSGEHIDIQV